MTSPLSTLLGVPDEKCVERLSWQQNKFGGQPDWMSPVIHPSCVICKRQSYLVVQVYCPLTGSPYHRTLYVFSCPEKSCRQDSKSWSVLRMQKLAEQQNDSTASATVNISDEKWTDGADDWGSDGDDDDGFSDEMPQSISNPVQEPCSVAGQTPATGSPIPDLDSLCISESLMLEDVVEHQFTCYHMNVFNEPEGMNAANGYEQRLLQDYAEREGLSVTAGWDAWDAMCTSAKEGSGESYEKVLPSHGDASFMKFIKRVGRCPEQCIRYCWSGKPLVMSHLEDGFSPPPCQSCGADRIFELQLMPALIPLLQPLNHKDISLDFGTVLVYTCSKSCWSRDVGLPAREECVILQQDPDHKTIGHL